MLDPRVFDTRTSRIRQPRRVCASLVISMLVAIPRFFWKSAKRVTPAWASRMISSDQRSPTTASARSIAHWAVGG